MLDKLATGLSSPHYHFRASLPCSPFWGGWHGLAVSARGSSSSHLSPGALVQKTHTYLYTQGFGNMSWLVNLSMLLTRGVGGYFLVGLACH